MRFDSQQDNNSESKKTNAAAEKLKETWKTDDGKKKILLFVAINLVSIYVIGYYIVLTSKVGLFQKKNYGMLSCILHVLTVKGLLLLSAVNLITIIGYKLYEKRSSKHTDALTFELSDKQTYGDAKLLNNTPEEKEVITRTPNNPQSIKNIKGMILGIDSKINEVLSKEYHGNGNRNIALAGGPGSGKSRAHIRNMILQCAANMYSMFITDPKGELAESMAGYLENLGYIVRYYNLKDFEASDSFNCLDGLNNEKGLAFVDILVDIIIKNTNKEAGTGGNTSAVKSFLTAIMKYVICEMPEGHKNMVEVLYMASMLDIPTLDDIFEKLDISHPAKIPYYVSKGASDNFRANIRTDAAARLLVYAQSGIQNISIENEIDLTLPGQKPCAYFIISQDQNGAYDFMVNLFQAVAYNKLVAYADQLLGGVLPNMVYMLYDEFSNIGILSDFTRKITTARSRGIATVLAYQSLPQLKNRYPDGEWEEILGACDTSIFAGCNDETTAEYYSNKSGTATAKVETMQTSANRSILPGGDSNVNDRISVGEGKRNLFTKDQLLKFKYPEQLIFCKGYDAFYCSKFDFSNHPAVEQLIYKKPKDHVPEWRKTNRKYEPAILTYIDDFKVQRSLRKQKVKDNQETPPIPDDIPQNDQPLYSPEDNWGTAMFNEDNVAG